MSETSLPERPFLTFACMVLGATTGILIALPVALSSKYGFVCVVLFAGLGGLIGKKHSSRFFLYFLLFCVLVLSSVIFSSMTPETP